MTFFVIFCLFTFFVGQLIVQARDLSASADFTADMNGTVIKSTTELTNKTFMYFAYGSNLLSKRIHIQNPTAIRNGIGKLKNYRLDFSIFSQRWNGAAATIVEDNAESVWGAIWEISTGNMESLDNQEGVHQNIYKPITTEIERPNGEIVVCRVYQQVKNPEQKPNRTNDIPFERQPSHTYHQVILDGAKESQLPAEYISFLESIPNNSRNGSELILEQLKL